MRLQTIGMIMLLTITHAKYCGEYKLLLTFNTGEKRLVDLKDTLFQERRKIFEPLRNLEYFKSFSVKLNTITWDNETDFAPEYLYEIGEPIFIRHEEIVHAS